MSKIPTLAEMLKAGMHFGHKSSKRHPKMAPFIYTTRGGINILDLNQTAEKLQEALDVVKKFSEENKTILFVGTKKQAQKAIKKYAVECQMPYIVNRWIGGFFTNYGVFKRNIKKYIELKDKLEKGELDKYTKHEKMKFKKEIEKLEGLVGGLVSLNKLPDLIFVVDTKKDKIAIREAIKMHIPIIAICDTNSNLSDINYPIPANDDALKSIEIITRLVAEAVNEGKGLYKNKEQK